MTTSPLRGHYTLLEKTPDRLLFTRTPQQRRAAGLALGAVSLVLFGVALFSILRPQQDMGGFVFFLLVGIVSAGAMLYLSSSWTEFEFDRPRREIVRRKFVMEKLRRSEALPFEQIKRISLKTIPGEVGDAYAVQIFRQDGSVWATLPGYTHEIHAESVRQKILAVLQ